MASFNCFIGSGILNVQTKMSVSKRGSYGKSIGSKQQYNVVHFLLLVAHYIGLGLAAHIGQKG